MLCHAIASDTILCYMLRNKIVKEHENALQ